MSPSFSGPLSGVGDYFAGSAFYDIEKDENGDPVVYMYSDDTFTGESYKIITDITPEEIYAKKLEYCNTGTDEERAKSSFLSCFYEKDGELYVKGAFSGMAPIYDLNSIELYNTEDDKYYILVDSYSNGIKFRILFLRYFCDDFERKRHIVY